MVFSTSRQASREELLFILIGCYFSFLSCILRHGSFCIKIVLFYGVANPTPASYDIQSMLHCDHFATLTGPGNTGELGVYRWNNEVLMGSHKHCRVFFAGDLCYVHFLGEPIHTIREPRPILHVNSIFSLSLAAPLLVQCSLSVFCRPDNERLNAFSTAVPATHFLRCAKVLGVG